MRFLWGCGMEEVLGCSMCVLVVCFFFFSSRRRHTRCSRDWSSDVYSSDLALPRAVEPPAAVHASHDGLAAMRRGHAARELANLAPRTPPLGAVAQHEQDRKSVV